MERQGATMSQPRIAEMQIPLRQRYNAEPEAALVIDRAHALGSDPGDPFHSIVMPMPQCGIAVPVGVHRAIGGLHDAPTPGDILCAALVACQDSSVRMVANILGITLESLEVEVTGDVDVRGTLAMNAQVPVGFQAIRCAVRLKAREGTNARLLEKLRIAAHRSCVVLQTLLHPPRIDTTFDMAGSCTDGAGCLQAVSGRAAEASVARSG